MATIPLYRETSYKIGKALTNNIFCKHGLPSYLIFDKDQAFLSSVRQHIYKND